MYVSGPTNNFRLGNLKKPTYAPLPGLSSTTTNVNQPSFVQFAAAASSSSNELNHQSPSPVPTELPGGSAQGMSGFPGAASSSGPYNPTTIPLNSGDLNPPRPSVMSVGI